MIVADRNDVGLLILFDHRSGSHEYLNNGVPDFARRSYEALERNSAIRVNSVESSGVGGLRAGDYEVFNGITDFSGVPDDTFEAGSFTVRNSFEGASAGGLRKEQEVASHEGFPMAW